MKRGLGFAFSIGLMMASAHVNAATSSALIQLTVPAEKRILTTLLMDETGQQIARIDAQGQVHVFPGKKLTQATHAFVTLQMGSMTATYDSPWSIADLPAQ